MKAWYWRNPSMASKTEALGADPAAWVKASEAAGVPVLKVDVDYAHRPAVRWMVRQMERCQREVQWVVCERSPSGRGWHLWAEVKPWPASAREMVAVQLLLGSDVKREAYNWRRAEVVDGEAASPYWRNRWNVFYRRAP